MPKTRARPSKGRPRKPSEASEDVISRRRAQVREAQQSYRSRQQSQLSSLKARVKQLEDAFNHLSQTVQSFDGQVLQNESQWSQPRLFQAVQMLCDDIASQLKSADIYFQRSSNNQKSEESQVAHEQPQTQTTQTLSIRTRNDHSQFWRLFRGSSTAMIPSYTAHNDLVEPGLIPFSPSPVFETNVIQYATTHFTQRLYRASAESGLRLLSNTLYTDEFVSKHFGLLLQSMTRSEIRDYFTRVVSTQPCNPIVDSRIPFISLGGAGTHLFSPLNSVFQDLSSFEKTNGVIHLASDEQWFDVHDVERYLSSQGIVVGDFPPSPSSMHLLNGPEWNPSNSITIHGALSSTMISVVDEYQLIKKLSLSPMDLGCVAGFRRSDIDNIISQCVRWIHVGDPG
ncbi:hypothetical protein N7541_001382 [Penicillium brevicompactum]|uniref:Uncharacterized protein n=1 Tax=Penicillium brevicompactum TaxID=5074 RepID=A0A9W9RW38_PENBR|nr:hypothetical protein N7541_001382 [Penicillium brevicompactum]